jgi:phosphatidylserine decarboxylase
MKKPPIAILRQYLVPQHLLSRLAGSLANSEVKWLKNGFITWFIKRYQVNMSEAQQTDPLAYTSFNEFFTRALLPDLRPIVLGDDKLACPADGAISQLGSITEGRIIQAKGFDFSVVDLLGGDPARAAAFANGQFATIYLSPKDYHRVHMPYTASLREMIYVPGQLFSVNTLTASHVPNLFARNERVVCIFDSALGPIAMVLVGAMIVASIHTTWAGQIAPNRSKKPIVTQYPQALTLAKGDEMGRFCLGSTVVLLTANPDLAWRDNLGPGSAVRMGEFLAGV